MQGMNFQNKIELHPFCVASRKASASCTQRVTTDSHNWLMSSLLVVYTKVGPVKTKFEPRLKLPAVLLGT